MFFLMFPTYLTIYKIFLLDMSVSNQQPDEDWLYNFINIYYSVILSSLRLPRLLAYLIENGILLVKHLFSYLPRFRYVLTLFIINK